MNDTLTIQELIDRKIYFTQPGLYDSTIKMMYCQIIDLNIELLKRIEKLEGIGSTPENETPPEVENETVKEVKIYYDDDFFTTIERINKLLDENNQIEIDEQSTDGGFEILRILKNL